MGGSGEVGSQSLVADDRVCTNRRLALRAFEEVFAPKQARFPEVVGWLAERVAEERERGAGSRRDERLLASL